MKNYSKLLLSAFAILPLVLSSFSNHEDNISEDIHKTIRMRPSIYFRDQRGGAIVSECVYLGNCVETTKWSAHSVETRESVILVVPSIPQPNVDNVINTYK